MIEIKFTGEHPLEALASMTAYAMYCMDNSEVAEAAGRLISKGETNNIAAPTSQPPKAPASPTQAVPVHTTPAANMETAVQPASAYNAPTAMPVNPSSAQPPVAPAPTYTYEQIGKAGADLVAANPVMMPTLMALLQRYGVQLVTDLKQEQLGPFAMELRGLGARV